MKSIKRRPSDTRPADLPKKDWPKKGGLPKNQAANAPVSEFASPKLKIAGNLQVSAADTWWLRVVKWATSIENKKIENTECVPMLKHLLY